MAGGGRTEPWAGANTTVEAHTPDPIALDPVDQRESIGRYLILEQIGRGGMGVVFAAWDPELDRKIAVKLLRSDSRGGDERLTERLIREGQAMAKLSHANVIAVYDVGVAQGDVFIAMELVDGSTLEAWSETEQASWKAVLAVYVQAGRGLAAAHEVGLVHRDFKPQNALIGSDGRVRVADFGLAVPFGVTERPTDEELPSSADGDDRLTATGTVLGTPAYMAPEQHRGRPTDARSDQYSYCVALYRALYGSHPFRAANRTELIRRKNRGQIEDPPASSRVPAFVRRALIRGLAPDPARRWPAMTVLLAELEHDPWARTRRVGVVGGGALAIAGLVATISSTHADKACSGAARKLGDVWSSERADAVEAALVATGVGYAEDTWQRAATVFDAYAAGWTRQHEEACEATHVHGVQSGAALDRRMACLDRQLGALDAVLAVFQQGESDIVAKVVPAAMGLPPLDRCRDAARLAELDDRPTDPTTVAQLDAAEERLVHAHALTVAGRFRAGLAIAEEILVQTEAIGYEPTIAQALYRLGALQHDAGQDAAAISSLERAYWTSVATPQSELAAKAALKLTFVVGYRQARTEDGLQWARHAEAEIGRANLVELEPELHLYRGTIYHRARDDERSLDEHERCLELVEQIRGPDHASAGLCLIGLGTVLHRLEQFDEAESHYQRAISLFERTHGSGHPRTAAAIHNFATTLYREGKLERARGLYEQALTIKRRAFGPDHRDVAPALTGLANALADLGDDDRAQELQLEALRIYERTYGQYHPLVPLVLNNLGYNLWRRASYVEAEAHLQRAVANSERSDVGSKDMLARCLGHLARVANDVGARELARRRFQTSLELRTELLGQDHPMTGSLLAGLGHVELERGAVDRARALFERAQAILEDTSEGAGLADARFGLARILVHQDGELDRARSLATEAGAAYRAERLTRYADAVDDFLATHDDM